MKIRLVLAFAAVYVIWGSTYLAIRLAINSIPPFLMASLRFLLSGFILYFIMRVFGKAPRPNLSQWKSSGLIGILLLVGGNSGVVWAEQTIPTGIASLIIATVPIWMVICDLFLHKSKINFMTLAGIMLGFVGIWCLVNPAHLIFDMRGVLVLFLASFLWALGSVLSKSLKQTNSAFLNVGMQMIVGSLILAVIACLTGELESFRLQTVTNESLMALLYLIIFGSFIGFTAYIWLLKVSTVSRVSTYAYVNPVVAVILGYFFLHEPVKASTLAAGGIILLSVILVQFSQNT